LEVYDNDGSPGLHVPASAFREFSRELGGNTTQGITLQQQAENNSQLVMSAPFSACSNPQRPPCQSIYGRTGPSSNTNAGVPHRPAGAPPKPTELPIIKTIKFPS